MQTRVSPGPAARDGADTGTPRRWCSGERTAGQLKVLADGAGQVLATLKHLVQTKSGSFRRNNTQTGKDAAKGPEEMCGPVTQHHTLFLVPECGVWLFHHTVKELNTAEGQFYFVILFFF